MSARVPRLAMTATVAATLLLAQSSVVSAGIIPAAYDLIFGPPRYNNIGYNNIGYMGAGDTVVAGYRGGIGCNSCGIASGGMAYAGYGNCGAGGCGVGNCGMGGCGTSSYYAPRYGYGSACGYPTGCGIASDCSPCGTGFAAGACGIQTPAVTGNPTPVAAEAAGKTNGTSPTTGRTGGPKTYANENPNDPAPAPGTAANPGPPGASSMEDDAAPRSGTRGGFNARGSEDSEGFKPPVTNDPAGGTSDNGLDDTPSGRNRPEASPASTPGKTSDKKPDGARPAETPSKDDDEAGFGGGPQAKPLNVENRVAWRPRIERRRMELKANFGKADLVRPQRHVNSQWNDANDLAVKMAKK